MPMTTEEIVAYSRRTTADFRRALARAKENMDTWQATAETWRRQNKENDRTMVILLGLIAVGSLLYWAFGGR